MNPTWIYVAVIYALAVWLARRGGTDLPWRVAALFYALVLLFMFRPMTQAYVNVPVDYVLKLPPWAFLVRHPSAWNGQLNDSPLQIIPFAHLVRESWRSLHVPLWNPTAGAGYPLLANGQSAALSPLRLLALPLSLGHSFTAEAAMKILIALTFTYLLCRRRGYSELASTAGAVSFGFCSFLIVWLHFPLATAACFVPVIMLALDLLAERITYGRFVFAAVMWAFLLFAGHPETAAHIFVLAFMALVWIVFVERPFPDARGALRFCAALVAALAVAALLAAPFLAPFGEAMTKSLRFQQVKVNPPDAFPYSDLASAIILLQPHFYGDVPFEPSWGPERPESITGFAGILGLAGWVALLLNAFLERRFRTREMFFVIATPIVLGTILGWPVIGSLFQAALPIAANARMRLILTFLIAMQAAALFDLLERGRSRIVLLGLAAAALLFLVLMKWQHFDAGWQRDGSLLALIPSLVVILIASLAAITSARWRPFAGMAVVAVIVFELWSVGYSWNPVLQERVMYPRTPLISTLERFRVSAPPASFRIVGLGPVLFPNISAIYGLDDIRAHDPMANGRYLGLLRGLAGYSVWEYFAMWDNTETRLLDYLNVRYIAASAKAEVRDQQRFRIVYDGRDGRIFENRDVLPRFFTVPNVVLEFNGDRYVARLTHHSDWAHMGILKWLPVENDRERTDLLAPRPAGSPEAQLKMESATETDYRMRVNAPRYTLVVSSIPWWPGWKVEGNGTRVEPLQVNGAFLGFVVRPGTTDVRVHFVSTTFNVGATVSLLTIVLLVALSSESLRRRLPGSARSV